MNWTNKQMTGSTWLNKAVVASMICLLIPAACTRMTDFAATDLSCKAYRPISWSIKDSTITIKEIKDHNAVWKSLCKKQNIL